MKKTTTKKTVSKTTKTATKKAPTKKTVAKKPCACSGKKCKTNPTKKCCGKKDCNCKGTFEKQIAEIFGQLNEIEAVENLLKDYFFTELLKRGIDEEEANAKANMLMVNIETFEANVDIPE